MGWNHQPETLFVAAECGFFSRSILLPQNEQFYVADSMWVNLANVAPAMFFLVDRGGSTFDDGNEHTNMLGKQGFRIGGIDLILQRSVG